MPTPVKRLILVVSMLMLASCSITGIVYQHADWLALRRIDHYFDLTREQRTTITPTIESFIKWIKKEKVGEVLAELKTLRKNAADGLTEAEYDQTAGAYERLRAEVVAKIAPDAAAFLVTLSPEQRQHLTKRLEESNEELVEIADAKPDKFASEREDRVDDKHDFFEDILGDLTPAQREIIARDGERDQDSFKASLALRRSVQQSFLKTIAADTDTARLTAQLVTWGKDPGTLGGPDYAAKLKERNANRRALIVTLDQTLSAAQRKALLTRLDEWIDVLKGWLA